MEEKRASAPVGLKRSPLQGVVFLHPQNLNKVFYISNARYSLDTVVQRFVILCGVHRIINKLDVLDGPVLILILLMS